MRPAGEMTGTSAYGQAGYVAGFGEHEPESLDQQRARLQQSSGKFEPHPDDDDSGEHDWTITYTDMVTLLMAFFVILTAIAMSNTNTKTSTSDTIERQTALNNTAGTGSSTILDGRGFSITEGGTPANRDPVESQYDDPDVLVPSTTDPSPSGEFDTQLPATGVNGREDIMQSLPVIQPPEMNPPGQTIIPQPPQPQMSTQLAEQLQNMVAQNSLEGQVEVISAGDSITLRISDKILFASGRANLETSGQELVKKLSDILARSGGTISIEGHTDNIPISTAQFPSNWELSAARASMVLRQLVSLGLPADKLRAIAYADTKPVGSNNNSQGRASNRRVEMVISSGAQGAGTTRAP